PLSVATASRNLAALRNGLRDLGYIAGRNIKIESRFADGMAERFPALVADLAALKPAVILVGSTSGILAARKVTQTIPLIWFGSVDDPVALGVVESFARPGGNLTGFVLSSHARMVSKRLELLRDAGKMEFRIGSEQRVCGPGDVVVIPGGMEHEGWFSEDTEVIDFFAPPRDDFLVGGKPAYMSEG